MFRLASWFLKTRASRFLIPGFIKKNGIDMTPFEGHEYSSFAEFFSRKKDVRLLSAADALISPCDGLLSVFEVTQDLELPLKDSVYTLTDIIPTAGSQKCSAEDCAWSSVWKPQTIITSVSLTTESRPAADIRLNRRWWNFLETEHLGPVLQAEICAVLVGGMTFFRGGGPFRKGEDMGCFELAGSTVLIFLNSDVLERLSFSDEVMPALCQEEVRVRMGEAIGILKN